MRIITGKYGSRRFEVSRSLRLRPTTDFAKENLFNILSNRMDWEHTRALDLFSGTGSIGFELLSRGCPEVICVEINRLHIAFIQKVRAKLDDRQLIPLCTDAFRFIETHNRPFDLIFADPPYDLPDLERIPSLILAHNLLTPTGLLVLEHPKSYNFADFPGFEQKRSYGAVNFSFITNPQPS